MAALAGSKGGRKEFGAVGKSNVPGKLSYAIAAGHAAYGANGISHSLASTHAILCAIQNAIGV
jgi:hypothetical protein